MATYRGTDIDLTPTAEMAEEAQRGLDWRAEFNRGGTAVGVARANQLVAQEELSAKTVRRMYSFKQRHMVDREAEGWNPGEEGYPSAGRIAAALWGLPSGDDWVDRKRKQLLDIDDGMEGKSFSGKLWNSFELAELVPFSFEARGAVNQRADADDLQPAGDNNFGRAVGSFKSKASRVPKISERISVKVNSLIVSGNFEGFFPFSDAEGAVSIKPASKEVRDFLLRKFGGNPIVRFALHNSPSAKLLGERTVQPHSQVAAPAVKSGNRLNRAVVFDRFHKCADVRGVIDGNSHVESIGVLVAADGAVCIEKASPIGDDGIVAAIKETHVEVVLSVVEAAALGAQDDAGLAQDLLECFFANPKLGAQVKLSGAISIEGSDLVAHLMPRDGRFALEYWGGDAANQDGRDRPREKNARRPLDGDKVMTHMQRKYMSGSVVVNDSALGPRQIRVVASDDTEDRAGDILLPEGCVLDEYKENPIYLADHDPTKPIGTADAVIRNGRVEALVTFAPEGISAKADEYCGLAKAGILRTVSVGFQPVEAEPRKSGGFLYKKWKLLELSMVAIPANPSAKVIERSATVSIPAAELAALKAAAGIPAKLASEFRAIAKTAPKAQKGAMLRLANIAEKSAGGTVAKVAPPMTGKSLWHVGYLASALAELGWIHDCVEDEAEWTDDPSAVPGMLADGLRQIGAALVALTTEEVASMLAELAEDDAEMAAPDDGEKAGPSLTVKDIVGAMNGAAIPALSLKAGKVLSAANADSLTQARDLIDGVIQQASPADDAEMETRAAEIRDMEIKAFQAAIAA